MASFRRLEDAAAVRQQLALRARVDARRFAAHARAAEESALAEARALADDAAENHVLRAERREIQRLLARSSSSSSPTHHGSLLRNGQSGGSR